jgi:hypothetical protein
MKTVVGILFILCCLIFSACPPPEGTLSPEETRVPFDPDLYGWKTASWTPFTVADSITGFAYGTPGGRDRYVAVASTGVIGWSNDGDIWHRAVKKPDPDDVVTSDPFSGTSFNAAVWGSGPAGGIFVAVANDGKVALSEDGISWTAVGYNDGIAGFGSEHIKGIAYGNGIFVAVGGNANISYSSDGKIWTGCRDSAFGSSQLNDIAFDNEGGRFYIVGDDGKRGWAEPGSNSWHCIEPAAYPSSPPYPDNYTPSYTNNIRKVAVGHYGDRIGIGIVFDEWGGKRTAISTNVDFGGIDGDLHSDLFFDNSINGIAYGGGNFVAAGSAAMIGWWPVAEPGNNSQRYWRALSFTEFQWWEISALAAMKNRFYAGGVGGKIGYSK